MMKRAVVKNEKGSVYYILRNINYVLFTFVFLVHTGHSDSAIVYINDSSGEKITRHIESNHLYLLQRLVYY